MRATTSTTASRYGLMVIVLIALAAALVRLPAAEVGMMSDDYAQHAMLADLYPGEHDYAPFDLYAFFRGDAETLAAHVGHGTVPWWTTPDLHGTVMRPLASALLSLDHALWPAQTPGAARCWHLHSLLWLALMLIAVGLALRRLLPAPIALVALVLIACDACYATPLGWLANRCSLISATFAALALWAHVGWREGVGERPAGGRRELMLTVGFAILALAASEYGLAAPAYICAYELLAGPAARAGETADSPRAARLLRAARAMLPVLGLSATWLLLHRALGYGTTGSAVYVDPFTAPGTWLALVVERLPKLLAGALAGLPADTGDMIRRFGHSWIPWTLPKQPAPGHYFLAHGALAGALLLAAAGAWWLARGQLEPRERARLRALGLGALLSLLPLTVAPAHSRLLIGAQLGAGALVAAIVVAAARLVLAWSGASLGTRARALAGSLLALVLLYAHVLAELRWSRVYVEVLTTMNRSLDLAFESGDLLDDAAGSPGHDLDGREVIVVNAMTQTVGFHGQYWLHAAGYPTPHSWRALTMAELPLVAVRVDADTLELSTVQGALLETGAELFFRRADQGLPAPARIAHPGLEVEILGDDGEGHPTRVHFSFPVSLDDPRYLFLICTKRGLMRWVPPPPGQRAPVPRPQLPISLAP